MPPDPYKLIVESVKDYAILLLDANGVVTSWNPGAQAIKGYSAEEIIGKHFSVFYPPEERDTLPARELEIARVKGRFEEEGWRLRKDGSRFWAHVVISAVKDDAGATIGFAKVTRDLTEHKRAEEERAAFQRSIRLMSTPVIRLWPGVLLLPIVGDVDSERAEQIMTNVLMRVEEERARVVILDVAGIPVLGTYVAGALIKTTAAVELLGARAVVTGISASASRTIVRLGVDLSTLETHNQLAAGVQAALALLGKTIT